MKKNLMVGPLISIIIPLIIFWFCSLQAAFGNVSPESSQNILLITIDTLRPDHLGCYGYRNIKTPYIDDLAKNGVLFTNAYSTAPLTLPSHVSIMTGQYPVRHGVHDNGIFILKDSATTLPEILQGNGYVTGAIVASYVLVSHCGLNQGFDYYDDRINHNKGKITGKNNKSYREGEIITDLAKRWLRKNQKKPFFLWLHYFDPHTPYDPPAPFDSAYQSLPYDGEIAYTDQCLGDLFKEIKNLHLMENTSIIFIGDHGEGLWEHNEQTHGLFIYDTTLKVPLIISSQKHFLQGKKVTSLVRNVDIMPTMLEYLNIASEKYSIQGTSLISLLTGKDKIIQQGIYCESLYPQLNFKWSPLEGIITFEGWKYIQAPKPELYNLKNDPREEINLYLKNPEKGKALQKELLSLKKDLSQKSNPQGDAKQIVLSPETRDRLRSLGYISGSAQLTDQTASSLPDPKDKAPLLAKIDKARELEGMGCLNQAIEIYEEVVSQDPNNIMAHQCLGLAYRNEGKFEKAVNEIERVAELDPQYYDCQNILGLLYDQLAMPDKAIKFYKDALNINPLSADIHNNLGMVYLKMNNLDLAEREFKEGISHSSDPILISLSLANLGEIYNRQGNFEDAVKKLKRSVRLNDYNRDAHISLADIYYFRLRDLDQSIQEWERIVELWPDDYISYYRLAQLFFGINKLDQASEQLRKCLQLMPDFIEARNLVQEISLKRSAH